MDESVKRVKEKEHKSTAHFRKGNKRNQNQSNGKNKNVLPTQTRSYSAHTVDQIQSIISNIGQHSQIWKRKK
jgi:thymidylate synthase